MGVVSLVSEYAPTELSDLTMKDAFYAMLESVDDQCPRRDTLPVLGDFNASTGADVLVSTHHVLALFMRHVLVSIGLEL